MLSAAGLFFAVLSPNAYFALFGFAVAGLGLSLVFPFVFSARAGGPGWPPAGLMGPPVLAGLGRQHGLQRSSSSSFGPDGRRR
jgi:hypothetical protein